MVTWSCYYTLLSFICVCRCSGVLLLLLVRFATRMVRVDCLVGTYIVGVLGLTSREVIGIFVTVEMLFESTNV